MMHDESYGAVIRTTVESEAERVAEEVIINGWSKIDSVVDSKAIKLLSNLIDDIYQLQEAEFGREVLLQCREADQARCLTRYDKVFLDLAKAPRLTSVVSILLGSYYTLMLQNAVISRPESKNHQCTWHRDLPYQNFVSSEPLAINMLLVVDAFDMENGGTELLSYSHKLDRLPSEPFIEKHKVQSIASPGDVLCFDSMLFHRAGINRSPDPRRSINTQYSRPFIKPQYALHSCVPSAFIESEADLRLLGATSAILEDEREWRNSRMNRS